MAGMAMRHGSVRWPCCILDCQVDAADAAADADAARGNAHFPGGLADTRRGWCTP
jgi:hypothetical protein